MEKTGVKLVAKKFRISDKQPSPQEKRRRVLRGRKAGLSLPSSASRRVAEASDDVADARPDVLMYGGIDVLPQMQEDSKEMARRCKLGMSPELLLLHDERKLAAPAYLRHFAGDRLKADWAAPELDVDREERPWRQQYHLEREDPDFKSDRENLLQEFKFRKGHKRTEVEEEEWNFEKPERKDAFSERLQKLQQDMAEQQARVDKREAKVKARNERLDREQKAAEDALKKLEEEEDLENRVYPDCIPAYLMDRPSYYFYPSKLPGNKRVLAVAQQPVVVVVGETIKGGGKVNAEEAEDDDIPIVVDAPPDR